MGCKGWSGWEGGLRGSDAERCLSSSALTRRPAPERPGGLRATLPALRNDEVPGGTWRSVPGGTWRYLEVGTWRYLEVGTWRGINRGRVSSSCQTALANR